jgi:hypothetical protein
MKSSTGFAKLPHTRSFPSHDHENQTVLVISSGSTNALPVIDIDIGGRRIIFWMSVPFTEIVQSSIRPMPSGVYTPLCMTPTTNEEESALPI